MKAETPAQSHVEANLSKERFYRPELDILRFLAFLLVFLHHGLETFLSGSINAIIAGASGSGLQIFFFLSSFLITELLLREKEKTGSVHLRLFYIRRILRIWPLYFLFIGASVIVSKLGHNTVLTTTQFLCYLFLAGNWWNAFYGFIPTIAGPLWSISLEEQYYIVWPTIARFGKRALWIACSLFLIVSTATLWHLGSIHAPRYAVWCNSFVEFQFFALGAILAILLHNRRTAFSPVLRAALILGAAAVILGDQVGLNLASDIPAAGPVSLIAAYALLSLGVVLLFLGFFGMNPGSFARPFIYLGKISYGLYVFHDLSIRLLFRLAPRFHFNGVLSMVISLAVCILLASLSYKFLEMPFLRLKQKFTLIQTRKD
jgi:peptidoglycan/LPS O-acetylase OafA/YrhL